jgi:hypothetical protein
MPWRASYLNVGRVDGTVRSCGSTVLDKMEAALRHLSLRLDAGMLGYATRLEGLAMADPRSAEA